MTKAAITTQTHSTHTGAAQATLTTYTWAAPYGGAWGTAGNDDVLHVRRRFAVEQQLFADAGWPWRRAGFDPHGSGRKKEGSSSFLKKRTKRLLPFM